MKTFIILYVTFFFIVSVKANLNFQKSIDSLYNQLKITTLDTSKIKIYNEITKSLFQSGNYDEALKIAKISYDLINTLEPNLKNNIRVKEMLANNYNYSGIIFYYKGEFDEALDYNNMSISINKEIENKRGIANNFNNFAMIYSAIGENEKVLKYYVDGLKIRKEINDNKGIIQSYNNIGVYYMYAEKYKEALSYYKLSLFYSMKLNNKTELIGPLINIAKLNAHFGSPDEALKNYFKVINICYEIGNKHSLYHTYRSIGNIYFRKGDYKQALQLYDSALVYYNKEKLEKEIANTYLDISEVYMEKGDFATATDFLFKSLNICESNNDKPTMVSLYSTLANLNLQQKKYSEALNFLHLSLNLSKEINSVHNVAHSQNNIGLIYYYLMNSPKTNPLAKDSLIIQSEKYYLQAIEIFRSLNDENGIASGYNNLGLLFDLKGDYEKAIKYYLFSLNIYNNFGFKENIYNETANIGLSYSNMKNYNLALKYLHQAYNLAIDLKSLTNQLNSTQILYSTYDSLNDFKNAYKYQTIYIQLKDSVFNLKNFEKINEIEAKYKTEKKQLQIENLNKENALKKAELKQSEEKRSKQLILIYSFILGFIIILVFSIFLYRLFVQKKKANIQLAQKNIEVEQKNEEITAQRDEISAQRDLVTQQKEEIEHIHIELTDSINYAKRIQEAVLPISEEYRSIMGEHFILFRPKDIVSGDFYWTAKIENILVVAVADCTGHGVPGAFMSMLGISFLNEIIRNKEITKANEVLNELRKEIINALQQKGQLGEQKDGMDISLIAISQFSKSSELLESSELYQAQWAGANNPLWLVRAITQSSGLLFEPEVRETETTSQRLVLQEVKPDKMPIAIYERMESFTNHEIQLNSGDCIYLMSDGYEDQFGGPKGKKFLSKNLKELIIANCLLTMEEQKQVLEKTLVEWIGDGEQIDDITLLGIKI